jgi:hypothetical protein
MTNLKNQRHKDADTLLHPIGPADCHLLAQCEIFSPIIHEKNNGELE